MSRVIRESSWTHSLSTSRAMRSIIFTASTGYFPAAVSPLSITASVPSMTALATSAASARVGRGFRIIESSIWVAVMTVFPRLLVSRMMRFCTIGTFSAPTSTPRSPRATMAPSAASRISSRFATASGFSILAISGVP